MTKDDLIALILAVLDQGHEVSFHNDYTGPGYLDDCNWYTLSRNDEQYAVERVNSNNDAASVPITTNDVFARDELVWWLGNVDVTNLNEATVCRRGGQFVMLLSFREA